MIITRFLILLTALLWIPSIPLHAEVPIRFESLTVADGMIQNAVLCLHEDKRGCLWIGAEFGLNCYDGYTFHRYTHDPGKPYTLSHPIIFDIAEDREGNLWIATQNGLNRFDYHTQRFTHHPLDPQDPDRVDRNWANKLLLSEDGMLWVATWGNGLFRFDPNTAAITHHYRHRPDQAGSIGSNFIGSILQDRQGILWIGTRNGINRFNRGGETFTRYIPDRETRRQRVFMALMEDGDGRFWAGSLGGLFLFDPNSGRFTFPFVNDPAGDWLKAEMIYTMAEDPHGSLWVGTRNGLARVNKETHQVVRYQHNPKDHGGISGNNIQDLLVDSNGLLWVATYGEGLNKIVFQTKPFQRYAFDPDHAHGLSYPSLLSVVEDDAGIVWIGTRGGGLNRLDRTTGRFRHYKSDPQNPRTIINNDIPIIIQSTRESNELWVGTRGGLDRFDKRTESFTHFRHDPDRNDTLSHNLVYALLEDKKGILWAGTWGGGLNRYHRDTRTFTRYRTNREDPDSISSDVIWDMYEDRSGRLWIGTNGGLNRMDRDTGTFRSFRNEPDNPASLSNNFIFSIHEDSAGFLWIGTLGGLNRFDPETGRCERYSMKDGLPDNVIYGILEGDRGDLWFSTNKGLSRFNPVEKTFRNYSPLDGLQAHEFNMHSYWKNKHGELYFGGVGGLNIFNPKEIMDNHRIPPVVFTDFRIFNRPVTIDPGGGSPLTSSIITTQSINLSYKQHSISFGFSTLDFTHPGRNQYAYMLEGVDDDWIYLGNKHEITLAHLSPGEYTLRVRGTNSDGIWNEEGASIQIILNPPFWQRWWFRGLVILLVFVLIAGWHRARMLLITRRLKTEAAMERFFNHKGISPREREIILLVLAGKSNKQIEDELYISLGTVKNHVFNIYKKLGINNRVQLINRFKNIPPN